MPTRLHLALIVDCGLFFPELLHGQRQTVKAHAEPAPGWSHNDLVAGRFTVFDDPAGFVTPNQFTPFPLADL